MAIEQNARRHTQTGKDKREGKSDQKTYFSIGNMQILLDGTDEQRQRLAIDKGKNILAPKHSTRYQSAGDGAFSSGSRPG